MNLRFLLVSETLGMESSDGWGCCDIDNIPLPVKIILLILSIILLLCAVALIAMLFVYIWTGYDFTCTNNNVEVVEYDFTCTNNNVEIVEYDFTCTNNNVEIVEYDFTCTSNNVQVEEVEYSNYFKTAVNNFRNYRKQIDYIANKDNHSDDMLRLCNLYKSKADHPALRYLTNHIVLCDECYIKFYGGE